MPPATYVNGDLFGGISGLDYDSRIQQWYLASDDRSEHAPARFFIGELSFDAHQVTKVVLSAAVHFRHTAALPRDLAGSAIDIESIRVDQRRDELVVASEGDASQQIGPWIRWVSRAGQWRDPIGLPSHFTLPLPSAQRGPRLNRSIEGLALTSRDRSLWIALESPLLQDGPAASVAHGADVRLTLLGLADDAISQYVYHVDAAWAHGAGESSDNGISEILELNARELLVLERSGVKGVDGQFRFHNRLYCAAWSAATDVGSFDSLHGQTYLRVVKRLLLDFDQLGVAGAENFEAMSWGPMFGRGRRSLVIASDNNFFDGVPTQLLLFEVQR